MPDPIVLFFQVEQPTKNKVRFAEQPPLDNPEAEPAVKWLYITKKRLKELGDPEGLRVTIEPNA